jgi:RNA polymerase sigma-70 factor (ECF subfamily)
MQAESGMQTMAKTQGFPELERASRPTAPALRVANNEAVAPPRLGNLGRLFDAHHDRVFRAAYRVTGNIPDAEDVLQTVFLRLLKHEHDFDSVEDAGNYLYRAGVNAALDLMRSKKSSGSEPLEDAAPPDTGWKPDRSHHSPELRDRLRDAVAQLHPTAAEMFVLRYFEGYDNTEVARLMDTSEGTVAVTLHRTRTRLQKELGGIR